jgi:hypothetical protein
MLVRHDLLANHQARTELTWKESMKAYVITTAAVFGLLTVAHIWRAIEEAPQLAAQPWFILVTLVPAALCIWALWLLRHAPRA